jgi:TRAP-type mannitol/chloroaromatic compound transport system permease small subunit
MRAFVIVSRAIDGLTRYIGRTVAWLILVSIVISATNALVRKIFSSSSNAWLELQWYLFSAVFLLAAAHVLQQNAHVRIDILASGLRRRTQLWIDLVGHLFALVPLCLLMIYEGWPFFLRSFNAGEMSNNAGGLLLWPVKFLVVAGFALLLLQVVSEVLKIIVHLVNPPAPDGDGQPDGGGLA